MKYYQAIPSNSEMIFPGDHTPVRKVLLQYSKILLEEPQEKLNGIIHAVEDIISSSSNDIGYTKVDRDWIIETNHNLQPVASKPYTLPLKHQERVRKEFRRI